MRNTQLHCTHEFWWPPHQCTLLQCFSFGFCPGGHLGSLFFWRTSRAKNLHFLTAVLEFLAIFRFWSESNFFVFRNFNNFLWTYFWNQWFSEIPSENFHYVVKKKSLHNHDVWLVVHCGSFAVPYQDNHNWIHLFINLLIMWMRVTSRRMKILQ